jgi:regulatory protein
MPRITDIKPQKNKSRFNVYLDGKFSFGIDSDSLVKANLKIGQDISQDKINSLIEESDYIKVLDRVLNFFSYRPRTEKELINWFKRKEVGPETQKMVLEKINRLNLIDDLAFAKWWIEQRTEFRPAGMRLLKMELRQKGISDDIIDEVIINGQDVNEVNLAKKVIEKKMPRLEKYKGAELKIKLQTTLLQRGFSWEVIKETIDGFLKKE